MTMTQDTEEEVGKLFVGGLSWETTKEKLNDYFNRFGEIADCVVMKNPETGRSRGFGFVTFKDPNCVQSVLNSGPHHLDDRTIDPKSCNPKSAQKGKRDAKMANYPKIFLGGLPSDVNETVLRQFFSEYGKVVEVVIMYDQEKKKTRGNGFRGFGFLSFESEEAVNKVVGEHFVVISGKKVEVKRAEPREKSTNGIKSTLGSGNSPGSANDSQNGLSLLPSWWPQAGLPGSLSAAAAAAAAATANSIITSSPQLASTPLPVALPATGMMQPPPATPYPMWTHLPGWVPASSTTRMNGQTIPGQPSSGPGSGTQNFGPPTTVTVTTATAQPPTAPGGWSAPPMPAIYPPYPPWPPSGYPYPGLPPPPHHIWPNQSYLYGSTYPVGYPGYIPGGPISPGLSPSLLPGTVTLPQSSSTANLIVAANQQQPGPINQNSSGGSSQVPTSNNLTITTTSGNFSGSCSVSSASGAGTGQTNGLDPRSNQSTQSGDYAHEVSNYGPTRIYGLHSTESGNNAGNLGGHHNSTNQSLGTSYLRNSSIQAYHPYRRI